MADAPSKNAGVRLPLPPPTEEESKVSRLRISSELVSRPDPLDTPTSVEAPKPRLTNPGTAQRAKKQKDSPPKSLPLKPRSGKLAPALPDPAFSLQGHIIDGRYRIIAPLGEGGMGRVFKVAHVQLGKTLALKVIHHRIADDDEAKDLFNREALNAASVSAHPNITSIEDFGTDSEVGAYMVMEYLEGEKLSSVLRRDGKLGLRQACDTLLQTAEAIQYAHERGIVHCDIKTENIFLVQTVRQRRRTEVKLLDFGLAKKMEEEPSDRIAGTPEYVAPERIGGSAPSAQTDIYGLGILFYEVLTGGPPFIGTADEVLDAHLHTDPLPPSACLATSLDPAVEHLILKALEKNPEDRHRDCAAFIYELRTVMHMLGFAGRKRAATTRVVEKVVKEPHRRRDELARQAFDQNRLPMAVFGGDGTILVANPAFAKFIMGRVSKVEGLTVQSTPLAKAWTTLDSDLARAIRGKAIRRVIELDDRSEEPAPLLMRLEPMEGENRVIFTVYPASR